MCIANIMDAYLSLDEPTAIPRAIKPQMNEYTYRHGRDVKSSWKVVCPHSRTSENSTV